MSEEVASPAESPRGESARRWLWFAVKGAVTLALLWWVLGRLDAQKLAEAFTAVGVLPVVLLVVVSYLSMIVASARWRRVLVHLGERQSLWALFGDNLVGAAYNLVLPTSVGGDVARAVRSGGRAKVAEHAWAAVLFERVMGLLALVLTSSVGLLGTANSPALRPVLLLAVGLAVTLVAALLVAHAPLRLAAAFARRLWPRLGEAIGRVADTFQGPLARPLVRLEVVSWSLAFQAVALSVLLAPFLAWHDPALVPAVFFGVPIVLVISVAPVTIGGFGLRESAFVLVLGLFGLREERAVVLSLLWLIANLTPALGGVALLGWEARRA